MSDAANAGGFRLAHTMMRVLDMDKSLPVDTDRAKWNARSGVSRAASPNRRPTVSSAVMNASGSFARAARALQYSQISVVD